MERKKIELDLYYNHGQDQRFQGLSSSLIGAEMNIIFD